MTNTHNGEPDFEEWYRSSKLYRRMWVPHGIDQLGILRSLYKYRMYASGVMLDVGCGTRKFAALYTDRVSAYWGLDLMSDELHRMRTVNVYGEATELPFSSGSISTVLSTQMLGYVYDHESMLREVARVLCSGGRFIVTYSQSGGQSDRTDYYRFTPAYYRRAFEEAGLTVEVLEPRTGTMATIGENLSTMVFYRSRQPSRLRRAVCHVIQKTFTMLDRVYFDPHGAVGHIVIGRKL